MKSKIFDKCLVVSRHKLLPLQQKDVEQVCRDIVQVPELPTDPNQLRQVIQGYDAVIGSLPPNLIQAIQNSNVEYVTFSMKSLGVYHSEDEARRVVSRFGADRVAMLSPSRPGDPYRVTMYQGLKKVRIVMEEEPIIVHE